MTKREECPQLSIPKLVEVSENACLPQACLSTRISLDISHRKQGPRNKKMIKSIPEQL